MYRWQSDFRWCDLGWNVQFHEESQPWPSIKLLWLWNPPKRPSMMAQSRPFSSKDNTLSATDLSRSARRTTRWRHSPCLGFHTATALAGKRAGSRFRCALSAKQWAFFFCCRTVLTMAFWLVQKWWCFDGHDLRSFAHESEFVEWLVEAWYNCLAQIHSSRLPPFPTRSTLPGLWEERLAPLFSPTFHLEGERWSRAWQHVAKPLCAAAVMLVRPHVDQQRQPKMKSFRAHLCSGRRLRCLNLHICWL